MDYITYALNQYYEELEKAEAMADAMAMLEE